MNRGIRRCIAAAAVLTASAGVMTAAGPAGAIVGGRQALAEEFPFVVELTSPRFGGLCTASLIHPSWVLTATHCASGVQPADVQVRIGNGRTGTGGEIIPVKQIINHPDYAGGPDDLALLRLQWPSTNRPVRLAQPAESAYWDGAGDFATSVGWGITNASTGALAATLQRTTVSISPDGNDTLGHMRIWLDDGFNSSGPCQGDSGGPLLVVVADGNYRQAGVLKAANCQGGGWYSEVGAGPNHRWIRSHIPDLDAPMATDYPNNVYGRKTTGELLCYRHHGYTNGAPRWSGGTTVGTGFDGFKQLFTGSGAIYGVSADGTLRWYRHDAQATCGGAVTDWTAPGGKVIGTGFTGLATAFGMTATRSGQGGVLYTLDTSGNLRWYRHHGYVTGAGAEASWAWTGGTIVGTGWNAFSKVFPGEDGEIYALNDAGELLQYRHLGWTDGSIQWAGPAVVGRGWGHFTQVASAGDGVIYAVNPAGNLLWMRHTGHTTGTVAWEGPFEVGTGWQGFDRLMVHSFPPPPPLS